MSVKPLYFLFLPLLAGCVSVSPGQTQNEKASKINVQLGFGYLQQNNLEQASQKLSKALIQNPDSAEAHNAYAILQDRLLQIDKASYHYERATSLDPEDSQAANNYGTFLCRNKQEAKSEQYFIRALQNPLYRTPEYALTNAALCLMKIGQNAKAKTYLTKALASKNNFPVALLAMVEIEFDEQNSQKAKIYLDRYHQVAPPSAKSLWLGIRVELDIDETTNVEELAQALKADFPDSDEYQSWLELQ